MITLEGTLKEKFQLAQAATGSREVARLAMDCFDLTSLSGDESDGAVRELCDTAINNRLASVCIYPPYVKIAREAIKDKPVRVATVINFPYGDKRSLSSEAVTTGSTEEDVRAAVDAGATQIDIVLPYESFIHGERAFARAALSSCRKACGDQVTMKVILETAAFEDEKTLREACKLAIDCGADCLKTSTGKHRQGGATLEAAAILMDEAAKASGEVGCKISGGVKTVDHCAQYIQLARSVFGWDTVTPERFRIGASSLLKPLIDCLEKGGAACTPSAPG